MEFFTKNFPWARAPKRRADSPNEVPPEKRRFPTPPDDRRFANSSLVDFSYEDDFDSRRKLVPVIRRSEAADAQVLGEFQEFVGEAKSEVFGDTEMGVDGSFMDNTAASGQVPSGGATDTEDFIDMTMDEDDVAREASMQLPSQMLSEDELRDMGMLDDEEALPSSEQGSSVAQQEKQDDQPDDANGEEQGEEEDEDMDLFNKTFGPMQQEGDDEDDDDDNVVVIEDPTHPKGYGFSPSEHNKKCNDNRKRRPSTPPRPTAIKPQNIIKAVFPKSADPKVKAKFRKSGAEDYRPRAGPDMDRDRSDLLNAYWRSHEHAINLVPRLANYETLDWTRRYWVAVLLEDKKPSIKNNEKDFIWMRANKFTSVATVFHAYVNTSFTEKEELVLLFGGRETNMKDEMRSLDMFSHRFVVMRAVKKGSQAAKDAKTRSLIPDIEPPPVIEIDDD